MQPNKVLNKLNKRETTVIQIIIQNMASAECSSENQRTALCHKKRKDSLEGRLDRVLLAAELEFPNTLVPRLPQNS